MPVQVSVSELHSLAQESLDSLGLTQFKDTLFGVGLKQTNVLQLTPLEKSKIDALILEYLVQVGPCFLRPETLVTLDYLLLRFNVGLYHLDALLQMILPFHSTLQFVAFLNKLSLKKTLWAFLPLDAPCGRDVIVKQCLASNTLWAKVLAMANGQKTSLSFFLLVTLDYLEALKTIEDVHLLALVPVLVNGLAKQNDPVQPACQMIASVLVSKVQLSLSMNWTLIHAIATGVTPENIYPSLLCLLTIYHQQNAELNSWDSEFLNLLIQTRGFKDAFVKLGNKCASSKLGLAICSSMIRSIESADAQLLVDLTLESNLTPTTIQSIIKTAFGSIIAGTAHRQKLTNVVMQIHQARFDIVDAAIHESFLDLDSSSKKTKQAFYGYITDSFKGSMSEPIANKKTTLFLALEHPDASIRRLALEKLEKSLQGKDADLGFAKGVILSKLRDDDESVVLYTLEHLISFVEQGELVEALKTLVASQHSRRVRLMALEALVATGDASACPLALGLALPFATKPKSLLKAVHAAKSAFPSVSFDALESVSQVAPEQLQLAVESRFLGALVQDCSDLIGKCLTSVSLETRIQGMILASAAASQGLIDDQLKHIVETCSEVLKKSSVKKFQVEVQNDILSIESLALLFAGKSLDQVAFNVSVTCVTKCIERLVTKQLHWFDDSVATGVVVRLFKMMVESKSQSLSDSVMPWLLTLLGSSVVEFAAALVCQESNDSAIASILDSVAKTMQTGMDYQLMIPSLLIALQSPDKAVRSQVIGIFEALTGSNKIYAKDSFYGPTTSKVQSLSTKDLDAFVAEVVSHKVELVADATYLSHHFHRFMIKKQKKSGAIEYKESLLAFFLSHVLVMPYSFGQAKLLALLARVSSPSKVIQLKSLLNESLTKKASLGPYLALFTPDVIGALSKLDKPTHRNWFLKVLNENMIQTRLADVVIAIEMVTPEWYNAVSKEFGVQVLENLLGLVAQPLSVAAASAAKSTLRNLPLDSESLLLFLEKAIRVSHPEQTVVSKGSKRPAQDEMIVQSDLSLLTGILELLQFSQGISAENLFSLVPSLFDVLGLAVEEVHSANARDLEYIGQVCMDVIGRITLATFGSPASAAAAHKVLKEESIRIDVVVQIIRVSEAPHTQMSALILLKSLAPLFPSLILRNVVPIFTFMGASVVRRDDDFTFDVIQKTIEAIMPPLLVSGHAGGDYTNVVSEVLQVFVNALGHIPVHRQVKLFTVLVKTLGENVSLSFVLSMMFARLVHSKSIQEGSVASTDSMANVDLSNLAMSLVQEFDASVQFNALIQLRELASLVPFPNAGPSEVEYESIPKLKWVPLAVLGDVRLRGRIKLVMHGFMARMTKIKTLKSFVSAAEGQVQNDMLEFVRVMMSESDELQLFSTKRGKLTRGITNLMLALLDGMQELLLCANALLRPAVFVSVMNELLSVDVSEPVNQCIRRRALLLVKERVEALSLVEVDFDATLAILVAIIQDVDPSETEQVHDGQLALSCISLVAKYAGKSHLDSLSSSVGTFVGTSGLFSSNLLLVASTTATLSALISVLGAKSLPFLTSVILPVIELAKLRLQDIVAGDSLDREDQVICFTGLLRLLLTCFMDIPQFMSTFIESTTELIVAIQVQQITLDTDTASLVHSLEECIATKVQSRVLFPKLFGMAKKYIENTQVPFQVSIQVMTRLLKQSLALQTALTIRDFTDDFSNFFLVVFDYRLLAGQSSYESGLVQQMESSMIELFISFSLKLNDALFKPIFYRLVDWATLDWNKSTQDLGRCEMLYHLMDAMFGQFKSIFSPYFITLLDSSLQILETMTIQKKPVGALWEHVISSLSKYFQFDVSDLSAKTELYKKLIKPLVNQIGQVSLHANYESRMETFLVPCLSNLGAAVSSTTTSTDSLLKTLNKDLLTHTKSSIVKVRLASLQVLSELYQKTGEDMLPLFPETIPFLAEMLEDDDERVEKATRHLCLAIEGVLGEPIQPYFDAQ